VGVGVGVGVDVDVDAGVSVDGDGDGDVYDHSNDGTLIARLPKASHWRPARCPHGCLQ
jgi:hypothetical protein